MTERIQLKGEEENEEKIIKRGRERGREETPEGYNIIRRRKGEGREETKEKRKRTVDRIES